MKQTLAIGCDVFNGNIIIDVYDSVQVILFKIFAVSIQEVVFSQKL